MTLTKDIIRLNTEDKTHKNSEIFKKLSKTHFITPL